MIYKKFQCFKKKLVKLRLKQQSRKKHIEKTPETEEKNSTKRRINEFHQSLMIINGELIAVNLWAYSTAVNNKKKKSFRDSEKLLKTHFVRCVNRRLLNLHTISS